jgi:O-antigen/teichoic acid export membrane protein
MPEMLEQPVDESLATNAATSRRRFSVHVAWTLLARVLMTINSVAAGIIVARWLGREGYGQLAVINVAITTVIQLGGAGLPSANTYFISQERKSLAPAAANSFIFALVAGSLLAAGLTALAAWRPAWFGFISPRLLAIAALSIPFQLITLIGLNTFLAIGQVKRFNLLDVAGQLFVVLNAVLALIILQRGLWTLVSLNTAASLLVSALVVWLIRRFILTQQQEARSLRPDAGLFKRMVRYGVKSHVAALAAMLIFRADLLVVNLYRGVGEAGVYAVATQVAMMLLLLPGVIATLLFPHVASKQDERGELTCLVARHTTLVMLLICLAAVPASFLLPALYGADFAGAPLLLFILLPGVYLVGLESVLVQHFNAVGLPRMIPLFWTATLIINVALTFALVPVFGARGAATASTLSYALIFALVLFYFRAQTRQPLSSILLPRWAELRELLTRGFRPLTSGRGHG